MKISILGILLVLLSSVLATAAETTDFDATLPLEEQETEQIEQTADELSVGQDIIINTAAVVAPEAKQRLSDDPQYYYLSYSQEDIAKSQEVLQKKLDILYYVYEHRYLVHASAQELAALQEQGYVVDYRLVRENRERYNLGTLDTENLYYVYAFRESDVPSVQTALQAQDIKIITTNSYVTVIDLSAVRDKEAVLRQIVGIEGVEAAEQKPHYEVLNDRTNVVVGTEDVRRRYGLYGAGQIIAIADTGLDTGVLATLHPDIRGRVINLSEYVWDPGQICQGTNNTNDLSGHGTAVTGSAVGNGIQSGSNPGQHSYTNSYAGSAPEARLVFQAIGCDPGSTVFPPLPAQLYQPAYNLGARIHSNSYGSGNEDGEYNIFDNYNDQFVNLNKNFVLVMAAGNDRFASTTTNNAKNIITVGGFIVDQSNTQIYARGPTQDGRFKPDILSAAGSNGGAPVGIKTTYSSVQNPWPSGVCQQLTSNPAYCLASGTSIATPNVAGAAALVREYFITRRNVPDPSAALVKAVILNGGESIFNGIPNPNYGWGRMNLVNSFVNDMYWDFAFWDSRVGLNNNSQRDHTIYVEASGKPLRVTLDWTDPAACPQPTCSGTSPKLVNNLNLVVIAPNGQRYNGNDLIAPYDDTWDVRNNVERVEILNPIQGVYTLQVRAQNVPLGLQDFALVASYDNLLISYVPAAPARVCMVNGQPC